ncbi:hypothetical protein, partial [Geobacter sp.]|uniref:hypothetical protein n=1 Tax=Geobacter sp. TaxID=46610 RepID=UPI0026122EB3
LAADFAIYINQITLSIVFFKGTPLSSQLPLLRQGGVFITNRPVRVKAFLHYCFPILKSGQVASQNRNIPTL